MECTFEGARSLAGIMQLAASSPITTALEDQVDLANLQEAEGVEDSGWPNVEGRISLDFGELREQAGGS